MCLCLRQYMRFFSVERRRGTHSRWNEENHQMKKTRNRDKNNANKKTWTSTWTYCILIVNRRSTVALSCNWPRFFPSSLVILRWQRNRLESTNRLSIVSKQMAVIAMFLHRWLLVWFDMSANWQSSWAKKDESTEWAHSHLDDILFFSSVNSFTSSKWKMPLHTTNNR